MLDMFTALTDVLWQLFTKQTPHVLDDVIALQTGHVNTAAKNL